MRKALRRTGWALAATGGLGVAGLGLAQAPAFRPAFRNSERPVATALPNNNAMPSGQVLPSGEYLVPVSDTTSSPMATLSRDANPRDEAARVELALLAEPMLFSYSLSAQAQNGTIEIRGYVPNPAVRGFTLKVAGQQTALKVLDRMQIHATLSTRTSVESPDLIRRSAKELLDVSFGEMGRRLDLRVDARGRVTVSGSVPTMDDKLAISRKLRRVGGCTSVDNQATVPAADRIQTTEAMTPPPGTLLTKPIETRVERPVLTTPPPVVSTPPAPTPTFPPKLTLPTPSTLPKSPVTASSTGTPPPAPIVVPTPSSRPIPPSLPPVPVSPVIQSTPVMPIITSANTPPLPPPPMPSTTAPAAQNWQPTGTVREKPATVTSPIPSTPSLPPLALPAAPSLSKPSVQVPIIENVKDPVTPMPSVQVKVPQPSATRAREDKPTYRPAVAPDAVSVKAVDPPVASARPPIAVALPETVKPVVAVPTVPPPPSIAPKEVLPTPAPTPRREEQPSTSVVTRPSLPPLPTIKPADILPTPLPTLPTLPTTRPVDTLTLPAARPSEPLPLPTPRPRIEPTTPTPVLPAPAPAPTTLTPPLPVLKTPEPKTSANPAPLPPLSTLPLPSVPGRTGGTESRTATQLKPYVTTGSITYGDEESPRKSATVATAPTTAPRPATSPIQQVAAVARPEPVVKPLPAPLPLPASPRPERLPPVSTALNMAAPGKSVPAPLPTVSEPVRLMPTPASPPAKPTTASTVVSPSSRIKERIETLCGQAARQVQVISRGGKHLQIELAVASEAEAQRLSKVILDMPELAPYEVDLRVELRP